MGRKAISRHAIDASLVPRTINFKPFRKTSKFYAAFCGGYHTILAHESNSLYSFGLNNYGQLGLGDLNEHDVPEQIDLPNFGKIKNVKGGEHFTVVLTESG